MIPIIIPSLNPDGKLISLIKELRGRLGDSQEILIVNDGSDEQFLPYFEKAEYFYRCTILSHPRNRGKGAALKTAFAYVRIHYKNVLGVVTVDGDGQHAPADIEACMRALCNNPQKLILGCRSFSLKEVPFRSYLGNKLTSLLLYLFTGIRVTDTQTGLRGIPYKYMEKMIELPGERYEYELAMLMHTHRSGVKNYEIKIQTIYYDDNKKSHFHPVKDSILVYKTLFHIRK